jgi:hypothetical protein
MVSAPVERMMAIISSFMAFHSGQVQSPSLPPITVGSLKSSKKGHCGVVLVTRRHRAPERVRFLTGGVVHGVLVHFGFEVADAVPVDDHVQAQLAGPGHALVEQGQVVVGAPFPPGAWGARESDQVGAPPFHFSQVVFFPVAALFEIVGVAGR